MRPCAKHAFTLVELSIVLVILGLLVGGVLVGQSLIRAAELRAITAEKDKYITATYTFRDKYLAFPGDMSNAVRFWGAQAGGTADGTDATCVALTTAATSTATCNGDGNGQISHSNSTAAYERYRYWQHLANAGLVEGTYSGVQGAASVVDADPGINVARSRIAANIGWNTMYAGTISGSTCWFDGSYPHIYQAGGNTASSTYAPFLTTSEAWNLDTKMDDGRAGTGKVISHKTSCPTLPGCATTDTASDALYALGSSGTLCNLIVLY